MRQKRKLSLPRLMANVMLAIIAGGTAAMVLNMPEMGVLFSLAVFAIGTGPQLVIGFKNRYNLRPLGRNSHYTAALYFGIQTEVWVADIAENIYPNNSFLNQSIDDSAFLKNKTVHLPQAGSEPNVEVDRTDLPALITRREDTDLEYNVHEFTTDPILITNTEEVEASYNMRASVLYDHMEAIKTAVANKMLTLWGANNSTNLVRTSGSTRAAGATGQSGNRKQLAKNDLIDARTIMANMDIPTEELILVIDPVMYADLLKMEEFKTLEQLGSRVIVDGAIGRIMGMDVFIRSKVLRYNNDSTPLMKAYGSAAASTDNLGALVYHKRFVRSAYGNADNGGILLFDQQKSPQYYGDVFSALVRAGGQKKYTNERGVVSIIETTV